MVLDSCGQYSLPDSILGKNVIIFGVDMSSSVHLILSKGSTQGLNNTLAAET